jgi:hypothetical protein
VELLLTVWVVLVDDARGPAGCGRPVGSSAMGERAQRPFWIHQFTEYVIGFALVVFGLQDTAPTMPAAAGIVVLVNAAMVRGPLGAFTLIGRKVHRVIDVVVMAALIAFAVQPWVEVSALGRLVLVAIAVPMAFLWWYTDWEERAGRKQRRADRGSESSADVGRTAGRAAANAYLAGKRAIKKHTDDSDS